MTGMTPEWMLRAACRGLDSSVFFPPRGYGVSATKRVRTICGPCPVKAQCDFYAEQRVVLEGRDGAHAFRPVGAWAGLSEKERKRRRVEAAKAEKS